MDVEKEEGEGEETAFSSALVKKINGCDRLLFPVTAFLGILSFNLWNDADDIAPNTWSIIRCHPFC